MGEKKEQGGGTKKKGGRRKEKEEGGKKKKVGRKKNHHLSGIIFFLRAVSQLDHPFLVPPASGGVGLVVESWDFMFFAAVVLLGVVFFNF